MKILFLIVGAAFACSARFPETKNPKFNITLPSSTDRFDDEFELDNLGSDDSASDYPGFYETKLEPDNEVNALEVLLSHLNNTAQYFIRLGIALDYHLIEQVSLIF